MTTALANIPATATRDASRTLFDIGDDLVALEEFIASLDGDITAADEAVTAWLVSLGEEQAKKLDGYINLQKKLELEAAFARGIADEYAKRAKSKEVTIARLDQRLITHMIATNQKKIETASGRILAIQANGGKVPLIMHDVNPDDLPPTFQKVTYAVNTDAVRRALESGETLPFASLGEKGSHLRIR